MRGIPTPLSTTAFLPPRRWLPRHRLEMNRLDTIAMFVFGAVVPRLVMIFLIRLK
jgi:hypothetical protein